MRRSLRLEVAGALLAGAVSAGHAHAMQPTGGGQAPCTPVDCSSVTTAPFAVPSGYGLVPDDRPLSFIMTYAQGASSNPIDVADAWYDNDVTNPAGPPTDVLGSDLKPGANGIPDAFDWLLRGLNRRYDAGFRRIGLYLPAGTYAGDMASSQWWTMPQWKRDGFTTYVKPWLLSKAAHNQPVTLSIYAGYAIDDPCSLDMTNATPPDPSDASSMCLFHQNIQPWIDVGVTEYWFDKAANHPADLDIIQRSPLYRGIIRFGGEAIPHDAAPVSACDGNREPTASAVEAMPYTGLFRFVRSRFKNDLSVDPLTTDLNVMLSGHTWPCDSNVRWTFAEVEQMFNAGWTIQLQGHYEADERRMIKTDPGSTYQYHYPDFDIGLEAVYRLYDFGTIKSMLDYDNDGLNEVSAAAGMDDYQMFYARFTANYNTAGGYLDGDANGDGFIDDADWDAYLAAIQRWNAEGQQLTPVDLGPAWWH